MTDYQSKHCRPHSIYTRRAEQAAGRTSRGNPLMISTHPSASGRVTVCAARPRTAYQYTGPVHISAGVTTELGLFYADPYACTRPRTANGKRTRAFAAVGGIGRSRGVAAPGGTGLRRDVPRSGGLFRCAGAGRACRQRPVAGSPAGRMVTVTSPLPSASTRPFVSAIAPRRT